MRSVKEIGCRGYTPPQVEAWATRGPSPERIQALMADRRTRLVAINALAQPVAFGDLEKNGHVDFLYCAPEAVGKGIASTLYDRLEAIARPDGVNALYSEASEAARRFFLKKGFVVKSRRDFEIHGVRIHNYSVEKLLLPKR